MSRAHAGKRGHAANERQKENSRPDQACGIPFSWRWTARAGGPTSALHLPCFRMKQEPSRKL